MADYTKSLLKTKPNESRGRAPHPPTDKLMTFMFSSIFKTQQDDGESYK